MCARYDLHSDYLHVFARIFGHRYNPTSAPTEHLPSYNIAPTHQILAARILGDHPTLQTLRWGLIPPWATDPDIGNRLINARCETAHQKPSFRAALKQRRCLIPADGFYEWAQTPDGKQPHHIHMADHSILAFAGLWERWHDPNGNPIETCTILTTEPNTLLQSIHNRMPVIVPPNQYRTWLDPNLTNPPNDIFTPFPADQMQATPVSKHVNNPAHNDPTCIQHTDPPAPGFAWT